MTVGEWKIWVEQSKVKEERQKLEQMAGGYEGLNEEGKQQHQKLTALIADYDV